MIHINLTLNRFQALIPIKVCQAQANQPNISPSILQAYYHPKGNRYSPDSYQIRQNLTPNQHPIFLEFTIDQFLINFAPGFQNSFLQVIVYLLRVIFSVIQMQLGHYLYQEFILLHFY